MTTSAEPFVSVITPFYNGVEYLPECADSVLRQTYRNFEYLLIDNHSSDGASQVARDIAARDPRVRVIVPPTFLPQDDNYNFGLSQAAPGSAYLKVVAADDWIFPSCLTEMVALAEAHPRVGLVSSYRLRGTNVDGNGVDPEQRVMSGRDACRLYLLQGVYPFGSPTTVLYRASIVRARQPFYDKEKLHADTEATFAMLSQCDFGFVPQILSFSRTQADSEMGSRRFFVPEALDRFIIVSQYGRQYLDDDEYRQAFEKAQRWHYSVMARAWLGQRFSQKDEAFWTYHRRGLSSVGQDIQPKLFLKALGRVALRGGLSPLESVRELRSAVERRHGKG